MRHTLNRDDAETQRSPDDTVVLARLFDESDGCRTLAQRLLLVEPGESRERHSADDELLYVVAGGGELSVDGERLRLGPGRGVYLRRGSSWSLACDAPLELVSVLVRDAAEARVGHALVDLGAEGRRSATSARAFSLGVRPDRGCPSATQFIGYVPPGRAPDHYHHYDEVIYILAGRGTLHLDGEHAPLERGICVHLPARTVHCLENTGAQELELLGVFTPAGSPAEAYYPDGTPALAAEER